MKRNRIIPHDWIVPYLMGQHGVEWVLIPKLDDGFEYDTEWIKFKIKDKDLTPLQRNKARELINQVWKSAHRVNEKISLNEWIDI